MDRVLKVGLRIIYGDTYSGFENALLLSKIKRPTAMLLRITEKFANTSFKHPKFSKWFQPQISRGVNTRSKKQKFKEIHARTERFAKSPIPYLTKILNKKQ